MSQTKHTPGPWVATIEPTSTEGVALRYNINAPEQDAISLAYGQSQEHLCGRAILAEELEANAHLIASAPELLENLSNLVSWAENVGFFDVDDPVFHTTLNEARVAIAKAQGSEVAA